jgi:hypothetical protein
VAPKYAARSLVPTLRLISMTLYRAELEAITERVAL